MYTALCRRAGRREDRATTPSAYGSARSRTSDCGRSPTWLRAPSRRRAGSKPTAHAGRARPRQTGPLARSSKSSPLTTVHEMSVSDRSWLASSSLAVIEVVTTLHPRREAARSCAHLRLRPPYRHGIHDDRSLCALYARAVVGPSFRDRLVYSTERGRATTGAHAWAHAVRPCAG